MIIGIDCRLWDESGVGRYVRNLVEQLLIVDRKNSYTLFVLSKDKEDIKDQILKIKNNWKLEIRNWKLEIVNIRWHTTEEQLRFPSILNRENLDLVHFPYISVPIFYNKPFVVTIHDLIPYHFPTGEASTLPPFLYKLKLLGYKHVLSQATKKARKIIAVSNATKNEIIDHLRVDPSKVALTYEGTHPKIRNSKSEIRNNFENTKYKILNTEYFLYVGNAYPHKNLERLIKAFEILNSQFSTVNLILVGKEDYFYKRLKEKVRRMGLGKSIVFFGETTDEELSGLYKNAKALIMPSLMEGFGLPALEAMANKCLVLASDILAIKEICKDAAVYFDPYNIEDIAYRMRSVLSNNSNDTYHYSNKVEKGFERAKMFSWEKMARGTLRIYENCVYGANKYS